MSRVVFGIIVMVMIVASTVFAQEVNPNDANDYFYRGLERSNDNYFEIARQVRGY